LKNLIHPAGVRRFAGHLKRAYPPFDRAAFERLALSGLEALDLKARALHLASALEATLPRDFCQAADLLEASLAPAPADDSAAAASDDEGAAGWPLWAVGEYAARQGLAHPERALSLLRAVTQRFTAEWAIRPFLVAHPHLTLATLQRWSADPSAHVRRLVSEGSRPRLPWGLQLKSLIDDPSPTLPLLRALQDDPSEYVRRSVANHLNDIAKDHPELLVDWVVQHLPGASTQRRALLRHASRTLIKRGHRRMLAAWGLDAPFRGELQLAVSPRRAAIGGALALTVQLRSTARRTQKLAIDYAWLRRLANGRLSPKVFKGWVVELAAGESRTLTKRHSLKPVTTRRDHPGAHAIELLVNGRAAAHVPFTLKPAVTATPGRA
jgi:3-methyladenine DNA glycosylase AlkC